MIARESQLRWRQRLSQARGLWLALGMVLALVWVWGAQQLRPFLVTSFVGPIIATDLEQTRLNTALPIPRGDVVITQSFVPRWDSLREIELILVRYSEAVAGEDGRFNLQLYDDGDHLIAEESLPTQNLRHNQSHLFRFPPQAQSAGRRYTLHLSGSAGNTVTVWGYDVDVYGPGAAQFIATSGVDTVEETAVQDLRFTTRTQLTWSDAFRVLQTRLASDGLFLLLALVFIPLPGCLLLLLAPRAWQQWDKAAWWGVGLSLGVAVWPLLWFGLTLVGGRLWGWLLWLLFLLGWGAVFFLWQRRRERGQESGGAEERGRGQLLREIYGAISWHYVVLFLLLLLGLAVRILAVRDLSFPAWVDASRHGLITAVMAENGRTPTDYAPYLPVERFPYHFGFHTLAASLHMMTGWSLPDLLLMLGQLLNGLMPLALYTAVWLLTRQRGAALFAAFLVALPFFFPAYYATWGRFTQLDAMLIMPVLLAFTWLLLRGGSSWKSSWWLLGILIAGLFLIHFRVFLIYLPFVPIAWLISRGRHTVWLALAAILAFILAGPRLYQLLTITQPAAALSRTITNYNDFPISYVQTGWEQQFWWLAAVGLVLCLFAWQYRQRWVTLPLVLAGWVGLLFILLAGERLGLPETSLINVNSMYITLFVPLALFLAIVAGRTWYWLLPRRWLWQMPALVLVGALLTLAALFGIRQQITILNPQTILAQTADLPALQWVADNLPADAYIAVNSWRWLGDTWAGADGGAWLVPLTRRATTTPPVDYLYDADLFQQVKSFGETATAVSDWSDPAQANWLREQGVTHIFVGAKGGFFDPSALLRNPQMRLIYGRDGVFIFALNS